ncbi:MAG TPA: hypothetical protein VFG23_16155 [Polyangia bacterium]|nr:hypothetical protein [Polyangia bacterium]
MRRTAGLLLIAATAGACGGASPESGVGAYLQLANAQFVPGSLSPDTGGQAADGGSQGPPIRGVNLSVTNVYPGIQNVPLSGDVQAGTSVLVGLADDAGYWIVAAQFLDVQTPNNYLFQTKMSFSPTTPLGTETLIIRGVDANGRIGPAQQIALMVAAPTPTGALVITLEWDTESDMDLHAVVPNTNDSTMPIEIYYKNRVGLPPSVPGAPPLTGDDLTAAVAAAGTLDFDSNAGCVIDGRRQENIVYTQPPPSGEYTVRVDAASLCGQADAQWQVTATTADGTQQGFAQWEAVDADTRGAHGLGAGRLAFQFSIP